MAKVYAIANQKGGVGKTTTAVNLSASLAAVGKKTLVIDLDPQGNATTGFGFQKKDVIKGSYQLLTHTANSDSLIYKTNIPNLYVVPSYKDLSGAEIELGSLKPGEREFFLKAAIINLTDDFEYVFIDCPPSLGLLTLNALIAADEVIIPLQCEYYALEGLSQILETIKIVKNKFNSKLQINGIVLTMFDQRNLLSTSVAEDVRAHLNDIVYSTYIPRNVRVAEAPSHGKPAIIYDTKCVGSMAYLCLAKEFLEKTKQGIESDVKKTNVG